MVKPLDVSVVTVNYNHSSYLAAYVESLEHSQYPISEVLIVDNNSTDNSLDVLRDYPKVRVIRNPTNIGYSAALNQAFEQASCPLVCATGPDVIVEPDWLELLVAHYLRDPATTFAVASRVLTIDKSEINWAGGSLHYTGHLTAYGMWEAANPDPIKKNEAEPVEVGAVSSTSVLIDREKFLSIGGCDPDFFIYHEEFDYCYRARMRSYRCWYHPGSLVYHGAGTPTFSVRGHSVYPEQRPFFHTRNRLLSMLKNYQLRTLLGVLPILALLEPLNLAMLARLGLHSAYIDALSWLWHHRREISQKRKAIQPARRLDDKYLLVSDALSISPVLVQNKLLRLAKGVLEKILALYWKIIKTVLYQ